jgi:hypothetical protein
MMKLKNNHEEPEFEYEPVNSVLIDVSYRGGNEGNNEHDIEDS